MERELLGEAGRKVLSSESLELRRKRWLIRLEWPTLSVLHSPRRSKNFQRLRENGASGNRMYRWILEAFWLPIDAVRFCCCHH